MQLRMPAAESDQRLAPSSCYARGTASSKSGVQNTASAVIKEAPAYVVRHPAYTISGPSKASPYTGFYTRV